MKTFFLLAGFILFSNAIVLAGDAIIATGDDSTNYICSIDVELDVTGCSGQWVTAKVTIWMSTTSNCPQDACNAQIHNQPFSGGTTFPVEMDMDCCTYGTYIEIQVYCIDSNNQTVCSGSWSCSNFDPDHVYIIRVL